MTVEQDKAPEIQFSGEFMIPGQVSERIEADHRERYEFALAYAKGKRVLDIACGAGYGSLMLKQAGAESVVGVDVAADVVAHARGHYSTEGVEFHVGDICNFGEAESFGLVTCFETIEHVQDYRGALSNLWRVLTPGGKLIISTPNRLITSPLARSIESKPANHFHVREFTVGEFRAALVEHGFAVADGDIYGQRQRRYMPLLPLMMMQRWIWKPDRNTSAKVTRVERLAPRYITLVARKVEGARAA